MSIPINNPMTAQQYEDGQNAANRTNRIMAQVGPKSGRRRELVRLDDFSPSSGLQIWYVFFPRQWRYGAKK